jgi:hypothetical protein
MSSSEAGTGFDGSPWLGELKTKTRDEWFPQSTRSVVSASTTMSPNSVVERMLTSSSSMLRDTVATILAGRLRGVTAKPSSSEMMDMVRLPRSLQRVRLPRLELRGLGGGWPVCRRMKLGLPVSSGEWSADVAATSSLSPFAGVEGLLTGRLVGGGGGAALGALSVVGLGAVRGDAGVVDRLDGGSRGGGGGGGGGGGIESLLMTSKQVLDSIYTTSTCNLIRTRMLVCCMVLLSKSSSEV